MSVLTAAHWVTAEASAPGTCGELAQGVLPDGTRFHVTCPIDRAATVRVHLRRRLGPEATGLRVRGEAPPKTLTALRLAAALLDLGPAELGVEHWTELDTGKGMASSTADIVAAARALAAAMQRELAPHELAHLAASIESSDGVMYEGISAVDHRTGAQLRAWDWWPRFTIAMFVPPQTLDTADVAFAGQQRLARDYEALLSELDAAILARDPARLAAQATHSAELNEAFVPNPLRAALEPRLSELGALGLCVGHTGTVCGLLFPADANGRGAAAEALTTAATVLPTSVHSFIATTPAWPALNAERPG